MRKIIVGGLGFRFCKDGLSLRHRTSPVIASFAVVGVMILAGVALGDVFNMPTGQASLQFVTVGDPGNVANTTGCGAVAYTYQMGECDITTGQYVAFLDAVAGTDTYGLYDTRMANGPSHPYPYTSGCEIQRSGVSGHYSYSVAAAWANRPVTWVTWGDAARFANWLTNGEPTGPENATTTENGSYYLNGATTNAALEAVTRKTTQQGAEYVIPNENEWYKAAYYKSGGTNAGYWAYPTRSNTVPSNVISTTGTNNANCATGSYGTYYYADPTNYLTDVGEFSASPSSYGTFDQGGDAEQWIESVDDGGRVLSGGSFATYVSALSASSSEDHDSPAGGENWYRGFRIADIGSPVPEPGCATLLLVSGVCLLAFAWRRRRQVGRSTI